MTPQGCFKQKNCSLSY